MLAIFRSLSVYFLKNVCFIILNFISALKDAGYLLCVWALHIHEWACVFMEARVEGQSLILSVLLNCFSNSFFTTQCIFIGLAILAILVGQRAPEFCFFLPLTTSLGLQMYTVTSGFYVDVHQVLTLVW